MASASDLVPRLEQGCDHILADAGAMASWPVALEEDGIKVTYQKGSSPDRIMGTTVIPGAKVDDVLEALYNFETRRKWDTALNEKSGVIANLSDATSVIYMFIPGQKAMSPREMVNGRHKRAIENGHVVVHNKVEWPDKPITKDIVRATNTDVGYMVVQVGDDVVIHWVIQTDIGGWVGMINVRSITAQNLKQSLVNLRNFCKK